MHTKYTAVSVAAFATIATTSFAFAAKNTSPFPEIEAARQANPTENFTDPEAGFEPAFRLKTADGNYVNARATNPSPFLIDWDNDGDRDLLLGALSGDTVHVFLNIGDDSTPKYTAKGVLKTVMNQPLRVPGLG